MVNLLESAELRLGVPCRIGGLREEFSQESEESSAPVAVVGVLIVGLVVGNDELVGCFFTNGGEDVED